MRSELQMTSPIKGHCRFHISIIYMFGKDLDLCKTLIEIPSRIPSDGTGILIRTTEGWVGSKNNRVHSLDSFHQIPNSSAKLILPHPAFELFVGLDPVDEF